jgi:multidrug efflux pump subunit AcrA (membrane-fusion protein)
MLFQSSGWVEPAPWTVNVAALADGIVAEVHFKEGDLIEKDQLLVEMISEDADLHLAKTKAQLAQAEAECQAHAAATLAAEQEVARAHSGKIRAEAAMEEARDRWHRVRDLSNLEVSDSIKVEAEQRFKQMQAAWQESISRLKQAEAYLQEQRHQETAHNRFRESMVVAADEAQLRKDRMTIRSPMQGRVKKRFVEPGSKRMRNMDDPDSAVVAELYDPENLQVRVDVPLAEAGNLEVGQSAVISSALLPGQQFQGTVTSIVGMADIQRNTLQAKVHIQDPDPKLRPETLCRVAFYSPQRTETDSPVSAATESVWIPAGLVSDDDPATVWVVSRSDQTVRSRSLTLGPGKRDGLREVTEGLRANEWVVLSSQRPLQTGDRVTFQDLTSHAP